MNVFSHVKVSAIVGFLIAVQASARSESAKVLANNPSVEFIIKVRERVPMQQLAANAIAMGIRYSPAEIREQVAPSDAQYALLRQQIQEQGFEIVAESSSHLFLTVRGEKENVENFFQTQFAAAANGRRRAMNRPKVPAFLSMVDTVIGLDSVRQMRPHNRVALMQGDAAVQGGKLPAEIKKVYGLDALYAQGLTGQGQDIAIATYDGINLDDVNAYFPKIGVSPGPQVDVVNFNGTATYSASSAMETQLDAEFSGMIAPKSKIHIFTSAQNSDEGELQLFTAILDDNRAKVVNYSWGSCELEVTPEHKIAMDSVYARAVAQGVNITVASGDSGSSGCPDQPGTVSADYPASNPNVVAVGGTTLVETSSELEEAWSNSGGGISTLYALPDYQKNLGGAFSMRSMPDVAFNADPKTGEAAWEHLVDSFGNVSADAQWVTLGGTSIAAPQWAGFLALVNEARAKVNKSPLGFMNPVIYALSSSDQSADFNDVTSGSNGQYACQTGFDVVTGFGSMKGAALFGVLVSK